MATHAPETFYGHAFEPLRQKLEVAGSISDGVTGIFCGRVAFCRTILLVLTQPLTEISKANVPRNRLVCSKGV
jgi:hypothetical protein